VAVPIILRRGAADGEVQAWIIVASLLSGIALFAIILFALHKAGFFKRPHREQMQRLEKQEAPQVRSVFFEVEVFNLIQNVWST
jgi:hypothetical protein